MELEWDEKKMSTGLEEIDKQHREWLRCLKGFEEAVNRGEGNEVIVDMLNFLDQYTRYHFTTEEKAMELFHSKYLHQNKAAHEQFREKLAEISEWVKREGATSVEIVALKMELEDWITNHICSIDVGLREIVNPAIYEE